MKDIFRINSLQVYSLWQNVFSGLFVMGLLIIFTQIFPPYLSPIISTLSAYVVYKLTYFNFSKWQSCLLIPMAAFITIFSYTLAIIVINFLAFWKNYITIPFEFTLFLRTFIPTLVFTPIAFLTCLTFAIRGMSSSVCTDCIISNGHYKLRGRIGILLHRESRIAIINLTIISAINFIGVYIYYFSSFNIVNISSRDLFVFYWGPAFIYIIDAVYFSIRYYNLYVELRACNKIISPSEIPELDSRTWIRFYMICEDNVFLNLHCNNMFHEVKYEDIVETPFVLNHKNENLELSEAERIVHNLTGIDEGRLLFFFSRKSPDNFKHTVIRYFYLLPGKITDYPTIDNLSGQWINSMDFKSFGNNPTLNFSPLLNVDMTRLATILVTSKTYNLKGERLNKLHQYNPTFSFRDLYDCKVNFQDNTWIKIHYLNCDVSCYTLKKIWRSMTRRNRIEHNDR